MIFHTSFAFYFSDMKNLNCELLSKKLFQQALDMKLAEVVQNQSQILDILLKMLPSSTDICETDALFPQPKKLLKN